jgi:hypothetical protein
VKAGAGSGKTALLASWFRQRRYEGRFVAYHFFSQNPIYDTAGIKEGLRNLLRQLYVYYLEDEQLPPDEALHNSIYTLIKRKEVNPDEPLVIVLDALDEAEHAFRPPFPRLPANVFVIVSVRADDEDTAEPYLEGWREIDSSNAIRLGELDGAGIRQWLENERLRQQQKLTLQRMADDEALVGTLKEKTDGFPLYLSYLLPELVEQTADIVDEGPGEKRNWD